MAVARPGSQNTRTQHRSGRTCSCEEEPDTSPVVLFVRILAFYRVLAVAVGTLTPGDVRVRVQQDATGAGRCTTTHKCPLAHEIRFCSSALSCEMASSSQPAECHRFRHAMKSDPLESSQSFVSDETISSTMRDTSFMTRPATCTCTIVPSCPWPCGSRW